MGNTTTNYTSKTWSGSQGSRYQCDAFCQICQSVKEWDDLAFDYDSQCLSNYETVKLENHNSLVEGLLKIYNAGSNGDRNVPSQNLTSKIQLESKNTVYTADMYNNVIQYIIDSNDSAVQKDKTYLKGTYFLDLVNYINNLQLDSNRCSGNYNSTDGTCISCNSSCESGNCCDGCTSCDTILLDNMGGGWSERGGGCNVINT